MSTEEPIVETKACLICGLIYTTAADEPHTVEQCRDQLVIRFREVRRQLSVQTSAHSVWEQRALYYKAQRDAALARLEELLGVNA